MVTRIEIFGRTMRLC
jgi:flagellar basal body-associated protein FliL